MEFYIQVTEQLWSGSVLACHAPSLGVISGSSLLEFFTFLNDKIVILNKIRSLTTAELSKYIKYKILTAVKMVFV